MKQTIATPAKKTSQEIKVMAINVLHEYAEKFYNYEKQHFAQFIGKDIFKVDGSVKAKFEHEKISHRGQLPDGTFLDAHYWFENRYGDFTINVKICINGGSYDVTPTTAFCQYEEMRLTLFQTKDGQLQPTETDISHLQTRYNLDDLKTIAKEIEQAAAAYKRAADKMPYRFNDVFWIERLTR